MGDRTIDTLVENGEIGLDPLGHVVCIQDGNGAGCCQSVGAHHAQIHPADHTDTGTAPWCGADLGDGLGSTGRDHGMSGQEW